MPQLLKYISGRVKGFYNYRVASVFNTWHETLWKIRDKQECMHARVMSIFVDNPIQANLFSELKHTKHKKMDTVLI